MPAPLAVLFDFDGVLADTANPHVAAWERTLAEMGFDFPAEACLEAAEVDDRDFLRRFLASKGVADGDADVAGWVGRKRDATLAMLADEPRLYPGVERLVARLAPRVRLGIVSTAWKSVIDAVLGSSDLADSFEVIVAKQDVGRPKPDPEPYTLALKRMGLDPSLAVAIEDSPAGLGAALGAGLRCVAVGHRRPAGPWSEPAVAFVVDFSDLKAVEQALGL